MQDGQVIIVDEFTGRLMIGRRFNEGLHQALEAKEGVKVERENKTLATITVQNYFRMFKKLAGMTGTAKTEEAEFMDIYDIDVVEIPTNRPLIRRDDTTWSMRPRPGNTVPWSRRSSRYTGPASRCSWARFRWSAANT